MPTHIKTPTIIKAAGNKPKEIKEFIGNVNSKTSEVSIAKMKSPQGWEEPWQTPAFNEYTVVLNGTLKVEAKTGTTEVKAGEVIIAHAGESVRYSTPYSNGAEYMAICLPAFSPDTVNREE